MAHEVIDLQTVPVPANAFEVSGCEIVDGPGLVFDVAPKGKSRLRLEAASDDDKV